MNTKCKIADLIFALLIISQGLLYKFAITLNSALTIDIYLIILLISSLFIILRCEFEKLTKKRLFIYASVLVIIFLCFATIKSSNIPAGSIIDKGKNNDYYVIVNERSSQVNIKLYCDKVTFDLLSTSVEYVNISYTTSSLTKKHYLKSLQVVYD